VTAFAVIEPLDVIKDIRFRFLPAFVGLPLDALTFEQREEALQWWSISKINAIFT